MSSLEICFISAGCLVAGLFLGLFLGRVLPESHLNEKSKHSIQLASGMLGTISALVLGLLVASAKGTFDTMEAQDTQTGTNFIILSRCLEEYGPEAKPMRNDLLKAVRSEVECIWPEGKTTIFVQPPIETAGSLRQVQKDLSALHPTSDEQRLLIEQMRPVLFSCVQARWALIEESKKTVPTALYMVLVTWLTMLFIGFGLFSPRNSTVILVLVLSAFSVAAAIYLLEDMNSPMSGIIKVSGGPMQRALTDLEESADN